MNILTINANDNGTGGASRIAMDLHGFYKHAGHDAYGLVGRKERSDTTIMQLSRPFWRKALAYVLANDFDFFDGTQILKSELFKQADIVHCHNLAGWYFHLPTLREMAKIKPVVWTLHDMWALTPLSAYTESTEIRNRLFKISDRALYPATWWTNESYLSRRKSQLIENLGVHIVTPTKALADLARQTVVASNEIEVISNGIDTEIFSPRDKQLARRKLQLGDGPVLLFLGRASSNVKGYEDFKWMADQGAVPGATFVCVGAAAGQRSQNLIEISAISNKTLIADFLSAADVLVMPSRFEIFGLSMIEALSCGTPVVAYDVGGIGEVLSGLPGSVLVPPKDKSGLLEGVRSVFSRRKDQQTLWSEQSRRIVEEKYSLKGMGIAYLDLFSRLLA